ncbi:MAG: hypothetical protein KJ062_12515 [Thermoanaerobaculia bacterium]|nr:hypothetical protein [Thermoanaerobaculia bacterium]
MRRRIPFLLFLVVPLLLPACGKLFGPPPRPRTDGYSALVTVRADGAELAKFRLWVRGEAVRRSTTDAEDSTYFVRETSQGPVFEVDPAAKTWREGNAEALLAHLDDLPLGADFNHAAEANRRGVRDYHRESDAVFAGNACAIWRYDDVPDALNSPSTAYWTAPALDGIVVRKIRRIPGSDGTDEKRFVELTLVRFGAAPELFRVPEGYRREGGLAR